MSVDSLPLPPSSVVRPTKKEAPLLSGLSLLTLQYKRKRARFDVILGGARGDRRREETVSDHVPERMKRL